MIFAIAVIATSTFAQVEDPETSQLLEFSQAKKALEKYPSFDDIRLTDKQLLFAKKYVEAHRNYRSYHLLFAIKNTSANVYDSISTEAKLMILVSTLTEQTNLNDWGYLDTKNSFDGPPAQALLLLGKDAITALKPLLNDSTRVYLYGSETGTSSTKYAYRRKDFAFRYVSLLLGDTATFANDLMQRDNAIDGLIRQLDSKKEKTK